MLSIARDLQYDVLGRRIGKSVVFDPGEDNPGVPQGTTRYSLDDRWRILEESNATGTTLRTYYYGGCVDEPVTMDVHSGSSTTRYVFVRDDQYNVVSLNEIVGSWPVERYRYGDYGRPVFLNADADVKTADGAQAASAYGNPFLFTGRQWDAESGLYYYRTRYMDPRLGRFRARSSSRR